MKKTIITIMCLMSGVALISGCGKGGVNTEAPASSKNVSGKHYALATKANKELAKAMSGLLDRIKRADNSEATAKAIHRFADDVEPIWPQLRELSEKYPELNDLEKLPNDLKQALSDVAALNEKVSEALAGIMSQSPDPDVAQAHARLLKILIEE